MSMSYNPTNVKTIFENGKFIKYEDENGNEISSEEAEKRYKEFHKQCEEMEEKYSKPQIDENGDEYIVDYI